MNAGSISPALLTLGCVAVALLLLLNQGARRLTAVALFIGLLWAGKNVFIKTRACPAGGGECMAPLQPAWAGFCSADDQAAILKVNGQLYLAAEAGAHAQSTCVDVRFWQ